MEVTSFLVFSIFFLAIFTQSVSGFGLALVSMPLLSLVIGIQTAAPLVALVGILAEVVLLIYYRQAVEFNVVWQLALAALFGVPVGMLALASLDQRLVLAVLGVVVAGYALYGLFNWRLPEARHPLWSYGFGFLAGVLGGAYNTAGPPVIIYGNIRQWEPARFKGNLQGFFLLTSLMILVGHLVNSNFRHPVWEQLPPALLGTAAALLIALSLEGRLNPRRFRRLVLWLLLVLGGQLLLGI